MRAHWSRLTSIVAGVAACCSIVVAGAPPPAAAQTAGSIRLVPLVTQGLASPLFATHARDGSGRLFVVERDGRIRIVAGSTLRPRPFLDISGRVLAGGERG